MLAPSSPMSTVDVSNDVLEIDEHGLDPKRAYFVYPGNPDTRLTIYAQPEDDGSCSFYMEARNEYRERGEDVEREDWVRAYRCKTAAAAIRTLDWLIGWMA